jgi:hypothetical protein
VWVDCSQLVVDQTGAQADASWRFYWPGRGFWWAWLDANAAQKSWLAEAREAGVQLMPLEAWLAWLGFKGWEDANGRWIKSCRSGGLLSHIPMPERDLAMGDLALIARGWAQALALSLAAWHGLAHRVQAQQKKAVVWGLASANLAVLAWGLLIGWTPVQTPPQVSAPQLKFVAASEGQRLQARLTAHWLDEDVQLLSRWLQTSQYFQLKGLDWKPERMTLQLAWRQLPQGAYEALMAERTELNQQAGLEEGRLDWPRAFLDKRPTEREVTHVVWAWQ